MTDHLEIANSKTYIYKREDTRECYNTFSDMADLSVIVPAYNMEHYIRRCIDSLTRQQGVKLEIIVVNDGSTDKTADVVNEFIKNHYNIKLLTQNNTGLYHAKINGISIATGRFVTFVDADDSIVDDFYSHAIAEMQKVNADILEFGMRKLKGDNILFEFSPKNSTYECEEALRRQFEKDDAMCSNCNKIYKRVLFEKLSFDEDIRCHEEDKLMNVKTMCEAKRIMSFPDIGYIYDTREGSITTRGVSESYLEILETSRGIYEFVKLRKPKLSHMAGRDLCAHLSYCYLNLPAMGLVKSTEKRYQKQLAEEFRRIYRIEKLDGYKPRNESKNRKIMLALFHGSPIFARIAYRIFELWNKEVI